jgi:uncharacterized protein (TIGR03086 family)
MTDLIALHRRAVDQFGAALRAIRPEQWGLPTPCADWDVRALVNHLVDENLWTAPLLEGKTIEEVGDRFEGDLLGEDPESAWENAARQATAAVGQQDVSDRAVHVSFGDISGEEYVSQLTSDHVIHTWDVARAIGSDELLDTELVEFVFAYLAPRVDDWRAAGAFGPRVDIPSGSERQAELLALTGRRP